jgi:hypothetical protein
VANGQELTVSAASGVVAVRVDVDIAEPARLREIQITAEVALPRRRPSSTIRASSEHLDEP